MRNTRSVFIVFMTILFIALPQYAQAQTEVPPFSITVSNVRKPTKCTASRWTIEYSRTTNFSTLDRSSLVRYSIQTINDDVQQVRHDIPGVSYVADYWAASNSPVRTTAIGDYAIPFWSSSYRGSSIEYILQGDKIIWVVKATLTCKNGRVIQAAITSEPAAGSLDSLPKFTQNLVVALKDIPLYKDQIRKTDFLGTLKACQTFFVTKSFYMPRSSIYVWTGESITGHDLLVFDGMKWLPLVDVAENYGQPNGQPVLKQCAGKPSA